MLASFPLQFNQHFNNPILSRRHNSVSVRCGKNNFGESNNYYELLGISTDASAKVIKNAYRKLQKKYHPDIAGEKGHECTLMLNKAYEVLMRDDLRKEYDSSIGRISVGVERVDYGSIWKGPIRPQALFVDENACIGCRQCVEQASNTFLMDEAFGTARVKVQYGDDDEKIEISVDSCPVNCIHWVEKEELAALEYLIKPQPKVGYGIYGKAGKDLQTCSRQRNPSINNRNAETKINRNMNDRAMRKKLLHRRRPVNVHTGIWRSVALQESGAG